MKKLYEGQYTGEDGKEYVEKDGELLLVAKNGIMYRPNGGGFVKGSKVLSAAHTTERAVELNNIRREKKRAVVLEAANAAIENGTWKTKYGDLAFVAGIVQNAMIKATTPEDPKAIESARFVMEQAGLLEDEKSEDARKNESVLAALGREALDHLLKRSREIRGEE